jgi:hypothetical protein
MGLEEAGQSSFHQCCGSGAFLAPQKKSGMGKNSRSMIRDEHPRPYFRELRNNFWGLKIIKFSIADPGSGIFWIRV